LTTLEFEGQGRVFDEVPEHHVSTSGREPDPRDVLGGHDLREAIRESFEGPEGIEHFAIARGVGTATLDDVGTVGSVRASGVYERSTGGKGVLEGLL
jgi:hypothetical protein